MLAISTIASEMYADFSKNNNIFLSGEVLIHEIINHSEVA